MSAEILNAQHNDDTFENIWQELKWRGLVHVSTDEAALEKALSEESLTFYTGYDPTAASLHLGHLVQLLVMRRLQLAGHKPLGLVGGFTGLIGDPRQTSERVLNSPEVVAEWVKSLRQMSALQLLRDVGKHFRVGTMVKKEIVAKRLNSDEGISYTEFSYQILQGLDFLELNRRFGCTLQTGGSDQWGNLTSGTELIRKVEGKSVHAIGTPLITNSDGTKFGKSEGNAIWLNPQMCSPYAFYQFWLNTADADVVDRLKVFTFLTRAEIAEFAEKVEKEPFKREAQKTLAYLVTSLVHGTETTDQAVAASEALFGKGDFAALDEATLESVVAELPSAKLSEDRLDMISVLTELGFAKSNSEARRILKEGGASVNGVKVQGEDAAISKDDLLHGRFAMVRRGKKNQGAVELI